MTDVNREDLQFVNEWTSLLLRQLDELPADTLSRAELESAVGRCSLCCFQKNQFDRKLKDISGLHDFLTFCRTELGWEVEYDEPSRTLLCYEGNTGCLCPIVRLNQNTPSIICCCTRGEIRRLFEYALHTPVEVEIVHSIVRDGQSCVYQVTLLSDQ